MGLRGLPWCDFVQWTPDGMDVRRIPFESAYWLAVLRPALLEFYFDMYLPNLFAQQDGLLQPEEVMPGAVQRAPHVLASGREIRVEKVFRGWWVKGDARGLRLFSEEPPAPWGHWSAFEAPPPPYRQQTTTAPQSRNDLDDPDGFSDELTSDVEAVEMVDAD